MCIRDSKRTIPGVQRVLRYYDDAGCPTADMICLEGQPVADASRMTDILDPFASYELSGTPVELLERVVEHGRRAKEPDGIEAARDRCKGCLLYTSRCV